MKPKEPASGGSRRSEKDQNMNEFREMLRQTVLLAIAIFLITAPAPDAQDLSELSGGFFVQETQAPLIADEMIEP